MRTNIITGNAASYAMAASVANAKMASFDLQDLESATLHARTAVKLATPEKAAEANETAFRADLALAIHRMVNML